MGDDKYYIPERPTSARGFEPPVSWLLGPQLVAALKGIALHALYRRKLDPRDWMRPADWTAPLAAGAEELWFDYLADTGDGQMATYSMAYLCLSDLAFSPEGGPALTTRVAEGTGKLPRGAFLFVGGDTAYHVADYATLASQFQGPFKWAHDELQPEARAVLGIPGNHDYYDQLHGFNRQFRRPVRGEGQPHKPGGKPPHLGLPGFERVQEASYVAIRLPWGWEMWGLDTEDWQLDARQESYFATRPRPKKLIVATPSPTTVFGRAPGPEAASTRMFAALGLATPFVRAPSTSTSTSTSTSLADDECRLDISGDVHHYARYHSPEQPGPYASVVSGLGGAFHHPTTTMLGDVQPEALYPSPADSRAAVARALFSPPAMIFNGYVALCSALLSLVVYATSVHPSTRSLLARALRVTGRPSLLPDNNGPRAITRIEWSPLWQSLTILGGLIASVLLLRLALRWFGYQLARSRYRRIALWERLGKWALVLLAGALTPLIIWAVGMNAPIASVVFDVFAAALILGALVGIIWLALTLGRAGRGGAVGLGLGLLGLVHAVLQLGLPTLMVWGSRSAWRLGALVGGAAVIVALFALLGWGWMARRGGGTRARAAGLVVLWLALGAALIAFTLALAPDFVVLPTAHADKIWRHAAAALVGALLCPVIAGWYFAVTLSCHGHNNEAGGAARVQAYRQFIRFKLTPDELVGHVIAVDRPEPDGKLLRPRLVERFTVRPRKTTPTEAPRP